LPEHLRRVEHCHEPEDTSCPTPDCGRDPWRYLKDVLERLPTHPIRRIDELLPHLWQDRAERAPIRDGLAVGFHFRLDIPSNGCLTAVARSEVAESSASQFAQIVRHPSAG